MTKYDIIFNEKLNELMGEVIFPEREIWLHMEESQFGQLVCNAFKYHTEGSLSCSLDQYEKVYDRFRCLPPYDIAMPEMFIALQAIAMIIPNNLPQHNNNPKDYVVMKREINRMSEVWETIAAPYVEQAKQYSLSVAASDNEKEKAMRGFKANKKLLLPS